MKNCETPVEEVPSSLARVVINLSVFLTGYSFSFTVLSAIDYICLRKVPEVAKILSYNNLCDLGLTNHAQQRFRNILESFTTITYTL